MTESVRERPREHEHEHEAATKTDTDLEERLPFANPGLGASSSAAPRKWSRWAIGVAIVLIVGAAVFVARRPASSGGAHVEPDPPTEVVALGRLEPHGGVRHVAAPTAAAAPRVLEVLVMEGDPVERGQPLVVLDNQPTLQAASVAAERAVHVAEVTLEQTRQSVRTGRQESEAALAAARVVSTQADRDRERSARLHAAGAVASSQIEVAEASASQTAAELRRAEAAASRYAGSTDVRLAEARLDAARADLDRARAELELSTVRAPVSGVVLAIDVQPGERASTGTLLRLADLERMEAELEVYQESVPRIEVGDAVRLEASVFGDEPLQGTVRRIGSEVGRQTLTSTDPAAHADARVVRVLVALDGASTARSARFVGLEVIAHIAVDADRDQASPVDEENP